MSGSRFALRIANFFVRGGRIKIGRGANPTGSNSIALGLNALAPGAAAVALGPGCEANNTDCVSIGDNAGVGSVAGGNILIGRDTACTAPGGASVVIGDSSTAAGSSNTVVLGSPAEARDAGDVVWCTSGDANHQGHTLLPHLSTSDATPAVMDMGPGPNPGFAIAAETTYGFKGIIVARTVANLSAMWEVKGMIERTGATTTLLFSTVVELHDDTAGVALAVAANDTNDTLEFTATGIAATVIRWSGNIQIAEVVH